MNHERPRASRAVTVTKIYQGSLYCQHYQRPARAPAPSPPPPPVFLSPLLLLPFTGFWGFADRAASLLGRAGLLVQSAGSQTCLPRVVDLVVCWYLLVTDQTQHAARSRRNRGREWSERLNSLKTRPADRYSGSTCR